jgi:hypothetical protein
MLAPTFRGAVRETRRRRTATWRASPEGLVYRHGREAGARPREFAAWRGPIKALATLAIAFLQRHPQERVGFC